jgi:hypothetical protein
MDLLILLPRLNTALGTQKLVAVVVGNELVKTLETIGDVNYRAALKALKDARTSRNPRREFERAITCFGLAYESYYPKPWTDEDEPLTDEDKPLTDRWTEYARYTARCTLMPKKVAYSYKKASEAALYIAICYWVLREENLVNRYCKYSEKAFKHYTWYYTWLWPEGRLGGHMSPWGKSEKVKEEEEHLYTTMRLIENTPLEL